MKGQVIEIGPMAPYLALQWSVLCRDDFSEQKIKFLKKKVSDDFVNMLTA